MSDVQHYLQVCYHNIVAGLVNDKVVILFKAMSLGLLKFQEFESSHTYITA